MPPTASSAATPRTLATLGLLGCALPLNAAVVGAAALCGAVTRHRRPPRAPRSGRTILVSGGKMTKALHLARAFDRAGHRVVLIEAERYRLTGHRFSRAVDRFYAVPAAGEPGYVDALLEIVRREHVDVYVPVCSPASAYWDAQAKAALEEFCEVLHFDPATLERLDDKHAFAITARELGLATPDAHRITERDQVTSFDFDDRSPYVLKSIAYDPVRRLDPRTVPGPDFERTRAHLAELPISAENPWVMQAFVDGTEFCTHSTVRDGRLRLHCCCESSAVQLNYAAADVPEIETWVRHFAGALKLTGQISLDFIRNRDGQLYAIECNPRTHSAITMFYDHPDVARAFLDDDPGIATVAPTAASRPVYWLYHELWGALADPRRALSPLRRIRHGKEAIFDWRDPLPFLMVHHVQIPALLIENLRTRRGWHHIDFNIGKLAEPGGD